MANLTALIPLDGTKLSESAFELLPLLKSLGFDAVHLVSVWQGADEEKEAAPSRGEGELREVAVKGRSYLQAYLNEQANRLSAIGLEVGTTVRIGRPAEETVSCAEELNVDLILIATHGRTGVARWRLGSVADRIVRTTSLPTLCVGPNVEVELESFKLERILVPLDGSGLAEEALALARFISDKTGCGIDLVRSVSLTPVAYDQSMGIYPGDMITAMEDAARSYLARKREELGENRDLRTALLVGAAGEQLLGYLAENPASLVIMASHGRGGFVRAAMGSVTDRVLHGPAPVLVIRPEQQVEGRLAAAAKATGESQPSRSDAV